MHYSQPSAGPLTESSIIISGFFLCAPLRLNFFHTSAGQAWPVNRMEAFTLHFSSGGI
jgi:hypothetical protein